MNGGQTGKSVKPVSLGYDHICVYRPRQISSEGVRKNHVDLNDLVWSDMVSPCHTDVSLPSSPVLLKLEKSRNFAVAFILMMKIPCSYAHGPIMIEVSENSVSLCKFKKVMNKVGSAMWFRYDVRIRFLSFLIVCLLLCFFRKRVMPFDL